MRSDAELRQRYLEPLGLEKDVAEQVWELANSMAGGGMVRLSDAVNLARKDVLQGNRQAVGLHGSKAGERHDSRRSNSVRRVRDRFRPLEG